MKKLLIVDDEPYTVDGLYQMLSECSLYQFDLFRSYSTDEAIQRLLSTKIDIVISDIRMPGMDGIELLRWISERWPSCKVIFLTGYGDIQYAQQAIRLGCSDYILKTEGDEAILASIGRAINKLNDEALNEKIHLSTNAGNEKLIIETTNETVQRTHHVIRKLNKYVHENLSRDLSLDTLANLVYMNPSYLSTLYKQFTGKNISDYITELRVAKAKDMLLQSSLKIHEIGEEVGFSNSGYFTRFFKKHVGVTPQEYRN
jgi:two-component system response regulator YesN